MVLCVWCCVNGAVCMVLCEWCCVYGAVCMVLCVWCCVNGAVCMVLCVWCCVYGAVQADKRVYQMELVNREQNYNKLFSANPMVGVLDPLAHKDKVRRSVLVCPPVCACVRTRAVGGMCWVFSQSTLVASEFLQM